MSNRTHGRDSAIDDDETEFPFTEETCPGHAGDPRDTKTCIYCGIHVDSLRPLDEDDR